MAEIHNLIRIHGRVKAAEILGMEERALVDAAAAMLSLEHETVGISYAGWATTALPHRKLPDGTIWERQSGRMSLLVQPGAIPRPRGPAESFGVPYGAVARIIMLYLQSEALRTGSPRVVLGRSLNAWTNKLGMSVGGKTYTAIKYQTNCLAACTLTFSYRDDADRTVFTKDSIIRGGAFHLTDADHQLGFWEEEAVLGAEFFKQLQAHPVPLVAEAIRQISNNSVAIDIYIWLAYRLHSIKDKTLVPWLSLYQQFGAGYGRLRDFRRFFIAALKLAVAVYPAARLDVVEEGIYLYRSPPAVAYRAAG